MLRKDNMQIPLCYKLSLSLQQNLHKAIWIDRIYVFISQSFVSKNNIKLHSNQRGVIESISIRARINDIIAILRNHDLKNRGMQ